MKRSLLNLGELRLSLLFCLGFFLLSFQINGQTISGTVTDAENGEPLEGASVIAVGTQTGAISDQDGKYTLKLAGEASKLTVRFFGYTGQTVEIDGQSVIEFQIFPAAAQLDDVVITALGIERDQKTLGYAAQELEGVQQFNYNWHDNPYFTQFENTIGQKKDRVYGNMSVSYDFTDKLSLQLRSGTDYFSEVRIGKRAFSTQRFPFGQYREDLINFQETNTDLLLTYQDLYSGDQ